jgi:hypothetical protein
MSATQDPQCMPSTANWATEVGPEASGLLESEFEGTGPSYPDFLLSVVASSTYNRWPVPNIGTNRTSL